MNIYLYGIPPLQQRESLYSWLQRLAQSQGMSYTQITQLLELSRIKDMDAPKLPIHKNTFSKISNFNEVWFQGLFAINKSIRQFKSVKKQLRINHDKKPITSVCCECLKTDVLPYFRIEWRFNFWKVCPLHAIELNTTCPLRIRIKRATYSHLKKATHSHFKKTSFSYAKEPLINATNTGLMAWLKIVS
ncbi:TniQ family protein [Undibacterium sp. WLX3042]|uniref:TniQ family protein n=1 Tax=Undibacterium sp. WLX3042 TaxID=3412686 RepID=UPI003C2F5778